MAVTSGYDLSRQHLEAFKKEQQCISMPVTLHFFQGEHRVCVSRKGQGGSGGGQEVFTWPHPHMPFPDTHSRMLQKEGLHCGNSLEIRLQGV